MVFFCYKNIIQERMVLKMKIFKKELQFKEILKQRYLLGYVTMRKYPTLLFIMAKIIEMNNQDQNQVALYLMSTIY